MGERSVMGVDSEKTSCRVVLEDAERRVVGYGKSGLARADGVHVETANDKRTKFDYAGTFVVPAAAESYRLISQRAKMCHDGQDLHQAG